MTQTMPDDDPRNSDHPSHDDGGTDASTSGGGFDDPRITALKGVRGDVGAVRVIIEGEDGPTVPVDAVHEHDLAIGTPWTPELAAALGALDAVRRAKRDAMRLLERTARSRHDLEERLRRKGHEDAIIAQVCDLLERHGLLNDRALAEGMVRQQASRSGERLLELKLRRKGIDRSLTAEVIGEAMLERDTLQDACRLLETRLRSLSPDLDPIVKKRRLYAWLARRGYDAETCRDAIERVLPE